MKKFTATYRYLQLLIFFIVCINVKGQEYCVTIPSKTNKEALIAPYTQLDYSNYSFCVTIYIHVIRRDDGTGGQSPSDVIQILANLNSAFNPYQIYFHWDNFTDYIDNTSLYEMPLTSVWGINPHSDGIDIYLYSDEYEFFTTTGAGVADPLPDSSRLITVGYYLDENGLEKSIAKSFVLAHEIGHELYLWHTHHGTFPEDPNDDPFQCPELPNGSNSAGCGDYITDTPADPKMNFATETDHSTCIWTSSINNSPFNPDEKNIMAYTFPDCMEYFTFHQSRRMKNAMASLAHLKNLSIYNSSINACLPPPTPLNYYPNSANQELNLDLTDKPFDTYTYELYDIYGVLVDSGQSQNILKTLDTSTLLEGIYFLHFYENGLLTIEQIVVDH